MINGLLVRLDLLGLLYHTTVDPKDILAGVNLQPPTHLINHYVPNSCYCKIGLINYENPPIPL